MNRDVAIPTQGLTSEFLVRSISGSALLKVVLAEPIRHRFDDVSLNELSLSRQQTPLHFAAFEGHENIVKRLLTAGADTDLEDEDKTAALHYAASENRPAVIETLLASGANINARNKQDSSPLHIAVNKRSLDCVKVLLCPQPDLTNALDINIQDLIGDTALHDSIRNGFSDATDLLISHPSVDFSLRNAKGLNVLHQAAQNGDAFAVEKLLARTPELVDFKKGDGFAALHLATINGKCEVVELLLGKGRCDPNLRNNRSVFHLWKRLLNDSNFVSRRKKFRTDQGAGNPALQSTNGAHARRVPRIWSHNRTPSDVRSRGQPTRRRR